MLTPNSGDINNLEAENELTYWFTVVIYVEKFFYFRGMDYDGDHEFEWDIYDYILHEGIYEYFLPNVSTEFFTTHLEEVA